MPEDYQAILSDLGVDTSGTTDPANQSTDPTPDTTAASQPDASQAQGTDDKQTANPDPATSDPKADENQRKANEAFAAMRSENTKYKQFIQHMMKGVPNFHGTEADFINMMTEASYKNQAKAQGSQVSPEILKRMDTLEKQNNALAENANRQHFAANIKHLQETFKLTDSEIKEFITTAANEHLNLLDPNMDYVMLYAGMNHDKMIKKAVEDARQEWIKQSNKSNNAATPDGKSGTKDPEPTSVNTMAEFDSLLQSIPKNK